MPEQHNTLFIMHTSTHLAMGTRLEQGIVLAGTMTGLHLETAEPLWKLPPSSVPVLRVLMWLDADRRGLNECVCAETSSSWAPGLWDTTSTSGYSFNGLWHLFPCIGSSVFQLWVIPEAGWLLIVVKARPRVLQLEVITSRELSILHPSICRLLIRKYECLDVETFTIAVSRK